jgi:hypothetical integral membrane protein (TIGR02206 family)
MDPYLGLYPTGAPFQLFSAEHTLALLVILAANLGIVAGLRGGQRPRLLEAIRFGLIALSIVNQVAWNWWQASVGIWSLAYSLPLQVCTLSEALCVVMLLTRSRRLYNLLFFWCLAGAGNGLITPDLLTYSYPHFKYWIFFSAHGANVTTIVFMTVAYGFRPYWRTIWQAALATNVYLLAMLPINALTGGNYMYVARVPEFPSLIDYMGPWPWYILGLEAIGVVSFVLVYAPFALFGGPTPRVLARDTGAAE